MTLETSINIPFNFTPSGISHNADTGVSAICGTTAAILYNHFCFWIKQNKIKGRNKIDGKTWTYQSVNEILKHLPYLTVSKVRTAIKKLEAVGFIIKGNFNANKTNQTLWYALSDETIIDQQIQSEIKKSSSCLVDKTNKSRNQASQMEYSNVTSVYVTDKETKDKNKHIETTTKPPSSKPSDFPNTIPKVVDFFICLKDKEDLSFEDKRRLMQYPEEKVEQAIAYAYHPKVQIKKTRMHAIVYAIKNEISSAQECDPMERLAMTYNSKIKEYGYQDVYQENLAYLDLGAIKIMEHGRWNLMSLAKFNEPELLKACTELDTLIKTQKINC